MDMQQTAWALFGLVISAWHWIAGLWDGAAEWGKQPMTKSDGLALLSVIWAWRFGDGIGQKAQLNRIEQWLAGLANRS